MTPKQKTLSEIPTGSFLVSRGKTAGSLAVLGLPVFADYNPYLDWQFHGRKAQSFLCNVIVDTIDFKYDPTWFNLGRPIIDRALPFTHPNLGWL